MNRRELAYMLLSGAIVVAVYLFLVTAGHITWWPVYTAYHAMNADAFLAGHTYIAREPSPELLALPDPYETADRNASGCDYLWDASLYKGKYYLYWGPVPALLLAAAKKVMLVPRGFLAGDPHLAFMLLLGVVAVAAMLLAAVRKRSFPDAPAWTVALGVLLVAFATPAPYILARSSAYEVAIAGGQFFLLLGIFAVYVASGRAWLFAIAGACWAAAVGCRASYAFPVIGLAAMVAWKNVASVYPASARGNRLGPLIAFGLPLAAGAVALVAYNVVRFGDPLEFGVRYQLSVWNMPKLLDSGTMDRSLGSASVMIPNLRDYLFAAPVFSGTFPYIALKLPPWSGRLLIEPLAGIVLTFPFCLFALVPVRTQVSGVRFQVSLLWAAVLLNLVPLLRLNMPTMRYLEDIIPCIMILGVIGVWRILALPETKGRTRTLFLAVALACAAYSIAAGTLLGFTGQYEHFAKFNPVLYEKLVATFSL